MTEVERGRPTRAGFAPWQLLLPEIRHVVCTEPDPSRTSRAVAQLMSGRTDVDRLIAPEHRVPDPTQLAHHLVHAEPDGSFSIVAIAWLPGQKTSIHDHLCWCVVTVLEGAESETRYRLEPDRTGLLHPIAADSLEHAAGSVVALAPPGDIHQVANRGAGVAVSLHVYGANLGTLGTSIRRCYADDDVAAFAIAGDA